MKQQDPSTKKRHYLIHFFSFCLVVLAFTGCGGGGGGGGTVATTGVASTGSSGGATSNGATGNNNNNIPTGGMIVQVTNPALPANTTSLQYTINDQSGHQVTQQMVAYSGGQPASQIFSNVPSTQNDTATVAALDSSNNVIIQGNAPVYVAVSAFPTVNVTLGDPNAIALLVFLSQPANVVAGATESTVAVAQVDATNNLAINSTQPVTLALSNGGTTTLNGTLTQSPVRGVASFSDLSVNTAGSGYEVTATSNGPAPASSAAFNVVAAAGAPTQVAFTVNPYDPMTMNEPFAPAPQVAVEDANGVIVNTATDAITLSISNNPSGATLSGTTTQNAVGGLATYPDLSINVQGPGFELEATDGNLVPGFSTPFDIINDQSGPNPPTGNVDTSGGFQSTTGGDLNGTTGDTTTTTN